MERHSIGRPLALTVLTTVALVGCPRACDDGLDQPGLSHRCEARPLHDAFGGVVVLRGASLSADSKWSRDLLPPYGVEDLERLRRDFGMNAVRLLVFWEGIEPLPGVYDQAYLDALRDWVEKAGALDMHVIVDMHQDVYGRGFGHAGAPYWSCDADLYASFEPQEPWFLGYLQSEVGQCLDRLYQPGPTRAAFVAAWARLARALRGAGADLHYELLNEPFWGSLSAGELERRVLPDLYQELVDVIRDVDDRASVLVQPSPATNVGVPTELASPDRPDVGYAPHYYPPAVELGSGYGGEADALRSQVGVLCSDAERLDMPLVVGELGVRRNVRGAARYLGDLYGALDDARASAFFWSYGRGGRESYGMLDPEGEPSIQGRTVARPYLARTAGEPIRWEWDPDAAAFTAEWVEDGEVGGDTVVSIPRLAFPHGILVDLARGGTYFEEEGRLRIPPIGGERRLTVRARPAIATKADRDDD
ncbi:MAG: cellulase family glycosylhydrolase [Myxococcota bacterium]